MKRQFILLNDTLIPVDTIVSIKSVFDGLKTEVTTTEQTYLFSIKLNVIHENLK